ncbi:MAG: LysE family translocator [Pseudorhodobacter sp.]
MPVPIDLMTLLAFVPAALALNLTPGADMMFTLGQGLRGGAGAALGAAAGITAGCFVHVAIAAIGLGAVLATYPLLFDVIRWLGVGYLLWLAYGALRAGGGADPRAGSGRGRALSPLRAFRQGLVVNLTNPKVILFVLAFIPQFVDPARGQPMMQFLLFGAILSAGGMIVNSTVGLMAGRLGGVVASPRATRLLGLVSAAVFTFLALRLAILSRA